MKKILKNIYTTFILVLLALAAKSQVLDYNGSLSFGTGYFSTVKIQGNRGIFFNNIADSRGLEVKADYSHKIKENISTGLSISNLRFSNIDGYNNSELLSNTNEQFFIVGINGVLTTKKKNLGFYNRFGYGISVTPEIAFHSGTREYNPENLIFDSEGNSIIFQPMIMGNNPGYGGSLSLFSICHINTFTGIKTWLSARNIWFDTGYGNENMFSYNFGAGIFFTMGRDRLFFF